MQLRPILGDELGRDIRLAAAHANMTTTDYLHTVVHELIRADLRQRQQAAGLVEAIRTTLEDGVPVERGSNGP